MRDHAAPAHGLNQSSRSDHSGIPIVIMQATSKGPRYLMRWNHSSDQRIGRDVVETTHRLGELPIFSDERLTAILDRCPRQALRVNTMGNNPAHPSHLQLGQLGGCSGSELIQMIRRGRLCVRICSVATHDEELGRIVQRLCGEMMECQPGLRTYGHDGDLEISSTGAMNYYGIDIQLNAAWQIRGTRTVWVYPTGSPFVHQRALQEVVASNESNPLYYEPAFEDQSLPLQQTAGSMLALPQHMPYRTVNDDGLSVTLTTKFVTRESERRNSIHCANHMLNRFFPSDKRSIATSGLGSAAKCLLLRIAGARRSDTSIQPIEPTFCVNLTAPRCVGPLLTTALEGDKSTPIFPGLPLESGISATNSWQH